jgi:TRAP-type mannitol/chloroaromatic compound transport system permease large subunit
MSDPAVALIMLGILVFVIMIGFPVAFTLMALGVGFGYYAYFQAGTAFFDNRVFQLLTTNTFTVLNNDALVSIPLFLMMGCLVERATYSTACSEPAHRAQEASPPRSRWRRWRPARCSRPQPASSARW